MGVNPDQEANMALKDDVLDHARELEKIADEADATVRDVGLGELTSEIRSAAVHATELAGFIPTPAEARTAEAETHSDLVTALQRIVDWNEEDPVASDLQALARRALQNHHALNALTDPDGYQPWHAVANWSLPIGTLLDLADARGDRLRVGDRVQVSGSDRYGNPTGTVRGPGPDLGDGKERVHVELDGGVNSEYTPSTGRVKRMAPDGDGRNGSARAVLVEVLPSGLKITQIPA